MPASNPIQLEGNLKLATAGQTKVDYSTSIQSMVLTTERMSVTLPGTLGNARETEAAGAKKETLTITFRSGTTAASVWAELYEAINTETAEVDFEGTFNTGAVAADNPKYSGRATLLSLDTGADVGALRAQTITLPVTQAGVTVAVV